jgi:hypothetical protein
MVARMQRSNVSPPRPSGWSRWRLAAAATVAIAACLAAWAVLAPSDRSIAPVATTEAPPPAPATSPAVSASRDPAPVEELPIPQPSADLPTLELPPGFSDDPMRLPWGIVDLDAVRDALPDNTYWRMAAPTDDLRVQQEREDERSRWNVEYGKVLSGTGTEEEIQAYFAHRQRMSADYVEFVGYVLDHYGDRLPDQDVGLLELARKLHLARLEEIPRKTQEAIERKQAQDAAREAWLQQEAEFAAGDTGAEEPEPDR